MSLSHATLTGLWWALLSHWSCLEVTAGELSWLKLLGKQVAEPDVNPRRSSARVCVIIIHDSCWAWVSPVLGHLLHTATWGTCDTGHGWRRGARWKGQIRQGTEATQRKWCPNEQLNNQGDKIQYFVIPRSQRKMNFFFSSSKVKGGRLAFKGGRWAAENRAARGHWPQQLMAFSEGSMFSRPESGRPGSRGTERCGWKKTNSSVHGFTHGGFLLWVCVFAKNKIFKNTTKGQQNKTKQWW